MGWEEEGSPGQRQFPVFEHTKIGESAQRNRIYSKPLSRVMYEPRKHRSGEKSMRFQKCPDLCGESIKLQEKGAEILVLSFSFCAIC